MVVPGDRETLVVVAGDRKLLVVVARDREPLIVVAGNRELLMVVPRDRKPFVVVAGNREFLVVIARKRKAFVVVAGNGKPLIIVHADLGAHLAGHTAPAVFTGNRRRRARRQNRSGQRRDTQPFHGQSFRHIRKILSPSCRRKHPTQIILRIKATNSRAPSNQNTRRAFYSNSPNPKPLTRDAGHATSPSSRPRLLHRSVHRLHGRVALPALPHIMRLVFRTLLRVIQPEVRAPAFAPPLGGSRHQHAHQQ